MKVEKNSEQEEKVEATEPEQADFTLNPYVVFYQGITRDGFNIDGNEKVVSHDPRSAAMRVIEGVVANDSNIAHIRAYQVHFSDTEDSVIFFTGDATWPPDPEVGPCLSPAPLAIDKRIVKVNVQIEKRTITTKDGTIILQLALRVSGNQANSAERALLDFRSGEDLLMTIVAAQSDFIHGKMAVDMGGVDETVAAVVEPDGTITPTEDHIQGEDAESDDQMDAEEEVEDNN